MTKILGVQYLLPPIVLVEICPRFKLKGFLCEGGGGGGGPKDIKRRTA